VNFFLRDLLSHAGVPGYFSAVFGSAGTATAAAAAGMPDHLIQALGRWSNAAYL
jgi:phosphoglycolate phosphatase-like HAD superfamily hydrolase